jgi:putative ABC transport system ATP-binding protein
LKAGKNVGSTALSLEQVGKRYNKDLRLVESASFSVDYGQIVVIAGPSGSGKSTILQMAAGLMVPDSGRIAIDGHQVFPTTDHNSENGYLRGSLLSYVPQDDLLFDSLSVYENLLFALELSQGKNDSFDKRVHDVLRTMDIDDLHNRMISEISAGERRRVAIARGLVVDSKIVIIDEPTSSLSSEGTVQLMKVLRGKADSQKAAFLIASHDLVEMRPFATTIYEIKDFGLHQI